MGNAYYEAYNSLFAADGKRIIPDPQRQGGIADSNTYNYYGKFGFNINDNAGIYLSTNAYSNVQDTAYSAGTAGVFGSVPTNSIRAEPPGEDKLTKSQTTILRYVQRGLFHDSELNLSGYYNDYDARYGFALTMFDSISIPSGSCSHCRTRAALIRSP